jgi:flagellar hook protein FlgE
MAVNGNGFFVVHSDKGLAFTRDGSFRFDKDGWMTSLSGDRVQAFMAGMDNKISSKLGDIRLDFTVIPAKPTGRVEIHANLDARLGVGQALDLTRPEETAHFTTATQIFDSVGNAHSLSVFMNRTSDSTWEWHAMTDGGELTGGVKGQPASVAQGTLTFDMHGKLDSVTQNILNTSFTGGAIPDQGLVFDFGDSLAEQGTGQKGCTMYGSANAVFRNNQNGWGAGVLADTIIDSEGLITGVYSNGQNRTLGQMAMARFDAMERLTKVGANQFKENSQSGQAIIGKANTGGRGAIQTRSLEQSNVDLASEFVDMIKSQRGFQASAKSITTANEMLEEVINLRQR